MSQNYTYPAVVSTSPSTGTNGTPIPGSSTLIAGKGPTGLETPVSVDASGDVNTNVLSSALPTGASTSALQTTGNTSLGSIDTKTATLVSGRVPVDGSAVTQPISAAALPLPSGASTSALQTTGNTSLGSIDSKLGSLGQKTSAGSAPVVIASDQSTLPVSGTVTANQGTANATPWNTNISQVAGAVPSVTNTLPIRISNGAAFVDPTQIRALTSSDTVTVVQATGTSLHAVVDSSTLPSGAATSALQTQISGQLPTTIGQKASAASLAVVLASDQSSLPISQTGNTALQFVRNDYTVTAVTTAAYVQLIASTTGIANVLEIFDSSGQTLKIAFGAAGAEVDKFLVFPGGNGKVTVNVPTATRISIKAVSANASVGEIDINLYT